MPPTDDEFTDILTAIIDGQPTPATGPPQPHRVLWFAVGTILWLANGILLYLFGWLLLHG